MGTPNKRKKKTFSHKSARDISQIIHVFTLIFHLEPHTGVSPSSTTQLVI